MWFVLSPCNSRMEEDWAIDWPLYVARDSFISINWMRMWSKINLTQWNTNRRQHEGSSKEVSWSSY